MLRLCRKSDIETVFRQGQRVRSAAAVLHARRRAHGEGLPPVARLTVIAGRPFRTAVARNRARRLLRETTRVALGDARAPWDLVFVARPEVLALAFPARLETVTDLLRQAGVLAEETVASV